MSELDKQALDRNEEDLSRNEEGLEDVEAHRSAVERADAGRAENAKTEDEPDVEGHAFNVGRHEADRGELGSGELGRNEGA